MRKHISNIHYLYRHAKKALYLIDITIFWWPSFALNIFRKRSDRIINTDELVAGQRKEEQIRKWIEQLTVLKSSLIRTIQESDSYPKDLIEELNSKGIEHFIHVKSNVFETLQEFQNLLNID